MMEHDHMWGINNFCVNPANLKTKTRVAMRWLSLYKSKIPILCSIWALRFTADPERKSLCLLAATISGE
jgi:hypothetical protein